MYKIFLFFLFFPFFLVAADNKYILGEGYQIASTPIYVGGYFSAKYKKETHENQQLLILDDAAFLSYGSYEKFSFLTEFELKNFYIHKWGAMEEHVRDSHIHTERLYLNYDINENYTLRVGKYFSPIGYWNIMPINVLRDTTSNPQSTQILFPQYTSGISLGYESFNTYEIKLNVTIQNNNDIDDKYNNFIVDKHYAIGTEIVQEKLALKFNTGYFHLQKMINSIDNIYYGLASFSYEVDNIRLMGEIGTQFSKNISTVPYSYYLQGVYTIKEKHSLIVRVESYERHENIFLNAKSLEDEYFTYKDDTAIVGYTYRPTYPVAFKIEYQHHSATYENQFLSSFSVLF